MLIVHPVCYCELLIVTECDFSCESSCSGPGNTACDSCADGYVQSEDGACLGKDRSHLRRPIIFVHVTLQIKMSVMRPQIPHYARKAHTVIMFLVVTNAKVM